MIVKGRLTTIVVPRTDLEAAQDPKKAYYLTGAVVDYVDKMLHVGIYSRHELPAVAMQAYHADYYLAQVRQRRSQPVHRQHGRRDATHDIR